DSRTLSEVFSRGSIRVGLDGDGLTDEARSFVNAYFEFLARRWKIKLEPSDVSTDEGVKALQGRALDVLVTPADLSQRAPDLLTSPFLPRTEGSTVGQLARREDDAYAEAMVSFLGNTLCFGRLGDVYRKMFGGEPPFAAIEGVLPHAPPQSASG